MTLTLDGDVQVGDLLFTQAGDFFVVNPGEILSRTLRSTDSPRPLSHGSIPGTDLLDARKFILNIAVVPGVADEVAPILDQISEAFRPSDSSVQVRFKLPGVDDRIVNGRPRNYSVDVLNIASGLATVQAEVVCSDPRMYAPDAKTYTMHTTLSVTGMTFPVTFDLDFEASVDDQRNQVVADNAGNFDTPYLLVITPCAAPRVSHSGSGKALQLLPEWTAGIVILDSRDRTVIYYPSVFSSAGAQNAYSWLSADSQWFTLEPGNNTLTFEEAGENADAVASIIYNDAWI